MSQQKRENEDLEIEIEDDGQQKFGQPQYLPFVLSIVLAAQARPL
jgi:hypothetical protein